ncbi:hypothetical protein IscW_ISCW005062, partial [Ixodes scapularis]
QPKYNTQPTPRPPSPLSRQESRKTSYRAPHNFVTTERLQAMFAQLQVQLQAQLQAQLQSPIRTSSNNLNQSFPNMGNNH